MLTEGRSNKDQQVILCRSFYRCNYARVIISKIMHMIFSEVTCFFFSPRFGVLKADFHLKISRNRSHFCNHFFVIDNLYLFGFFLFDLF